MSKLTGKKIGKLNRAAKFLPQTDDETRPCIELAGVQVYAYLDNDGVLRVSVDLDTADERLKDDEDCVTVRMTVQGETVYDSAAAKPDNETLIIEEVRETVAKTYGPEAATVVGVVFTADEWDDGYYLDHIGTVYFSDGHTDSVEFHGAKDLLTEEYGRVARRTALAVSLTQHAIEYDDYGNVFTWLGVAEG